MMMMLMMMMMISTRQAFHFSDWLFWASPGARLIFWLSSYFHFHFQSSESENQVPHRSSSIQWDQIMICRAGPHSDLFSLLYTSLLLLALLSMAASTRYSWNMPLPPLMLSCSHSSRGLRADSATGREVCLLVWLFLHFGPAWLVCKCCAIGLCLFVCSLTVVCLRWATSGCSPSPPWLFGLAGSPLHLSLTITITGS